MRSLQQDYLQALRQSQTRQKVLVGKSAELVALRNDLGEIVGYGEAEHIPLSDPEHPNNRHPISKSAGGDENDVFDGLGIFSEFLEVADREDVQKNACIEGQDDVIFHSTFPRALQATM